MGTLLDQRLHRSQRHVDSTRRAMPMRIFLCPLFPKPGALDIVFDMFSCAMNFNGKCDRASVKPFENRA